MYEYLVDEFSSSNKDKQALYLNKKIQEDWEFITVVYIGFGSYYFYFKRQV